MKCGNYVHAEWLWCILATLRTSCSRKRGGNVWIFHLIQVQQIMDAIDNPDAEFQTVVQNVQYGDNFVQVGDQNVGKVLGR